MEDTTIAAVPDEERLLARWLLTTGRAGECPDWYLPLKAAQRLCTPPWDLAEVYPDLPPASKAEWSRRAALAELAEMTAEERMTRDLHRQRRAA